MSMDAEQDTGERDSWFVRAAAAIGDLGDPAYAEERQRDVWNEAAAVGFQLALWLLLTLAVVMVWAGGSALLPWAVAVVGVQSLITVVVLGYARALDVHLDVRSTALGLRVVAWLALIVVFLVGVIRAAPDGGFVGGLAQGAVVGGGLGALWFLVGVLRRPRRRA